MRRESKLSAAKLVPALVSAAGLAAVSIPSAHAQSLSIIHTFTGGSDGEYSISNLVMKNGKPYGTTLGGGANDAGVIYSLTP